MYIGFSRDCVEARAVPWQDDHIPFKVRFKHVIGDEGAEPIRRYYRPDLDALLVNPGTHQEALTGRAFIRVQASGALLGAKLSLRSVPWSQWGWIVPYRPGFNGHPSARGASAMPGVRRRILIRRVGKLRADVLSGTPPHDQGGYREIAAAIPWAYRRHHVEPNVVAQIRHRAGFARLGRHDNGRTGDDGLRPPR
jgi:hypothetical protein